jgi:hypothetical protein
MDQPAKSPQHRSAEAEVIIYLALLVAVIGLLIYVLAKDVKIAEIGRIMFWVGLFCFLFNDSAIVRVLQR